MLTASKVHSCLDTLPNQNDLSCRKDNVQFCSDPLHLKTSYIPWPPLLPFFPGHPTACPFTARRPAGCVCPICLNPATNWNTWYSSKTRSQKKQTPSLSATQQPGLLKCNFEIETFLSLLLLNLFQSLCGPSQGAGFHDHGAINTAQDSSTKNYQPSPFIVKMCLCLPQLWCRCYWPVW